MKNLILLLIALLPLSVLGQGLAIRSDSGFGTNTFLKNPTLSGGNLNGATNYNTTNLVGTVWGGISNSAVGGTNLVILPGGNNGIGTRSPLTKLNVLDTVSTSPRGILSSQISTDTNGARVGFSKARGVLGTETTVVTADTLGRMMFRGYDGANYLEMASIEAGVSGTVAATRVPTFMAFSTATDVAPSVLTERMRILNSGNVGIGTTTPTSGRLVVDGGGITFGTDNTYGIGAAGANRPAFAHLGGGGAGTVGLTVGGSFFIVTNNAVGIGTTTPVTGLHVKGAYPIGFANFERTGLNGGGPASVISLLTDAKTIGDGIMLNIGALDSANNAQSYAQITASIVDPTSTTEAGKLIFSTVKAGTMTQQMAIDNNGNAGIGNLAPVNKLDVAGVSGATGGFSSTRSNRLAAATITVTSSPFNWTNTANVNVAVYIDGVSVTGTVGINGGVVFNTIGQNTVMLQTNEWTTITYTLGTPTATWKPF